MKSNRAIPGREERVGTGRSAHWKSFPARLDDPRTHYQSGAVRAAQAAVKQVFEGKGQLLGTGNFGASFKVETPTGPAVVKLASRATVHTRTAGDLYEWMRTKYAQGGRSVPMMRAALIHEAGIADMLWERGHRVVPQTVYAEHGGRPALVREYGEIVGPTDISPAEYDALGDALVAVVQDGVRVNDDLLVARRVRDNGRGAPAGSLFIADVGIWQVGVSEPQHALATVFDLLRRWAAGPSSAWEAVRQAPPVRAEVEREREGLRVQEAKIAERQAAGKRTDYLLDDIEKTRARIERMEARRAAM